MGSWAESARVEPVRRPAPRRAARTAARTRPRPFAGGVIWIVVLGLLLTGVVAVNVAVLQLNVQLEQLGRERVQLRADNARLESQLSSAAAAARIEATARKRLGLVPADPATTSYVQLAPETK